MVDESMISDSDMRTAVLAAVCMALLVTGAEVLHLRRMARIRILAFGPTGQAAIWTKAVLPLRVVCSGLLVWSLLVLSMIRPETRTAGTDEQVSFQKLKHIVLVLDVSPSMRLVDAGPKGDQSRMARAREVMQSYFRRIPMREYRVSVVATYTSALPVVRDTADAPVLENILNDLPMHFAFRQGETNLFAGISEAAELCRGWRPRSTTVVLVTDGDTVPATGMPTMPASVSDVLVVGVGDPVAGSFINGKHSKQDVSTLRQIAIRLKGYYHNGNENHLPSELLRRLTLASEGSNSGLWNLKTWAMLLMTVSAVILTMIPLLLHYFGTSWQPGIREIRRQTKDDMDILNPQSQNARSPTRGAAVAASETLVQR